MLRSPMRFRHVSYFCVSTLLWASQALAQTYTLSGTVTDTANLPVPETTVTLTLASRAGRKIATAGPDGKYSFSDVAPGTYGLVFDHAAFETVTRSGEITGDLDVSVSLPVAGVITSIDVIDVEGKATASRLEIPDRDIPVQVSSIPQQLLQQQGVNDMVTALRNASGVQAQRFYGVYEYYTIRGVNGSDSNPSLVMLVDGMRLEGNRINTQTNNIQSIEVLKGPSSVLYGGSALAGIVNIVRKKPQATRAYELGYRGGRFNTNQVFGGATGPLIGNRLLYRVDGSYEHSSGWRSAGGDRFNMSPSITWLMGERARITVHQSFNRDRFNGDGGVPVNILGLSTYRPEVRFSIPQDNVLVEDSQTTVLFNYTLSNTWETRDSFLLRRTSDRYFVTEGVFGDPANNQVFREGLDFHHTRRPKQNQADLIGHLNFLNMRHTVLLGYEYQDFYTRTDVTEGDPSDGCGCGYWPNLPPMNISTLIETAPRLDLDTIYRRTYQANRINAFYWQDQIDLLPNLKINVAGRFDDFNRERHRIFTANPDTRVGVQTRHQTAYTYRAGIVYSPGSGHSVYFNASSSFSPVSTIPPDGSELKPQTGMGYEIGHRWNSANGRVQTSVALYHLELNNLSYAETLTTVLPAGQQISKGVDIDINADLGRGVHLLANYGFSSPKFTDFYDAVNEVDYTGKRPRFVQKHAVNSWLSKSWQSGFSASIGVRYLSSMFTNNSNTVDLGGWTTFAGSASYRHGKMEYAVNAENLFNRGRYFMGSDYSGQVYPGQPINVFGTIRVRFN